MNYSSGAASGFRTAAGALRNGGGALRGAAGTTRNGALRVRDWVDHAEVPDLPSRNQAVAAVLAVVMLFGLYMLWFRDSSLVAINNVTIEGDGGDEALRRDVRQTALSMSTLHVDHSRFADITAAYAAVESISVDPSFPHDLTVSVNFHEPIAYTEARGRALGIAPDGSLLRGLEVNPEKVPLIDVKAKNGLATGPAAEAVGVLAVAPGPLLKVADTAGWDKYSGATVELQGGLELRFGDSTRLEDKWKAAAAVLADPSLKTASYVDLTVPQRPAVGGAG